MNYPPKFVCLVILIRSFSHFFLRCKCSICSLEFVVKPEECRCCIEVDRCVEKMEELEREGDCIIAHPGFDDVCLNRWVLHTAGVGLKTKTKKSYTTMLARGDTAEHEYVCVTLYFYYHPVKNKQKILPVTT